MCCAAQVGVGGQAPGLHPLVFCLGWDGCGSKTLVPNI